MRLPVKMCTTEVQVENIIMVLASFLALMHKKGLPHRDLKLENALCVNEDEL